MEGVCSTTLFETDRAKGRAAYKLYAASMVTGMCLIWFYRATHGPGKGEEGRWAWMGMLGAEIWFGFYWIITQSVRWRPVYRRTFKERLSQRCRTELPGVDIFVCTADPVAEPPTMVISTVLSIMAYNYPSGKLSVYVSDDAASELTFYALWETSCFARHWLPFCRRFNIEPRSPAAYFSGSSNPYDSCNTEEWSSIKEMYKGMANRIGSVVAQGKVPEELKQQHKGFSEWNPTMTSRNHQSIVQILIDGRGQDVVDMDGNQLPSLVYMAREKRPMHHHNFKAGAMNALIRVSSVISNSPIILNVDCDMYSNNSESIRDALCFFLDEEEGHNVGFVQFPQNFDNITKNDHYSNSLRVISEVEFQGLDSWGGPMYIGTGCFHRRESLCGRKYSRDYKENWKRGTMRKVEESPYSLEDRAMALATCTHEKGTQWGNEIGLKYGFPVEDIITGLSIHCRGWKSIYFNPARKGFLGVAPATLAQTLVQHKRWSEGNFQIFTSKYCSFLYGHGKMKLGLQMGYSIYGLWAANSFPFLYYVVVTSLCLLKGISLFPEISSAWFIPFAYVTLAKQTYSLVESLLCGETLLGWWNTQRMWVFKRVSSYLFATIEIILKLLGMSQMAFTITVKVIDGDVSKRYEQEVLEFGASSSMFVVIGAYALLNLVCLVGGVKRIVVDEGIHGLDQMVMHVFLCVVAVLINGPVYNAMFFRKDKGSMPSSVMFASFGFVILACLFPLI